MLATYGIRLDDHGYGPLELGELVESLPRGCPFWQSFGGVRAWSETQEILLGVEFRLRENAWQAGGRTGKRPEPPKPPPLAYKAREVEQVLSERQRLFEARFGK